MSTDTSTTSEPIERVESPDDLETAPEIDGATAQTDFTITYVITTALGFVGGILFTIGYLAPPAVSGIPIVLLGAGAGIMGIVGPVAMYFVLRDEYGDVFATLRQMEARI